MVLLKQISPFWTPLFSRNAAVAVGEQEWLAVQNITMLARCDCSECCKKTSHPDCAPWQGFVVLIPTACRWRIRPESGAGKCPNSGIMVTWGAVVAVGFAETVVMTATLRYGEDESSWNVFPWDLRREGAPVFFEPQSVHPFAEVVVIIGDDLGECRRRANRMMVAMNGIGIPGFLTDSLEFSKPPFEVQMRPIEPVLADCHSLQTWADAFQDNLGKGWRIAWKGDRPMWVEDDGHAHYMQGMDPPAKKPRKA
eukprot:NODE_2422_length_1203_cov_120.368284_g2209_i0.p1 GENE.NODE_2422_length_1203_cov_120.368284_g2209_i0~~NODE_2422_length_1203_cov_120.368284_g2209_i0.p1  ORF type:complete len:253 (+),score=23.64 NODE_2422_length_1203_cov_120.368284_g2209_i0:62-820(+)